MSAMPAVFTYILNCLGKLIEATDFEKRLEQLERGLLK